MKREGGMMERRGTYIYAAARHTMCIWVRALPPARGAAGVVIITTVDVLKGFVYRRPTTRHSCAPYPTRAQLCFRTQASLLVRAHLLAIYITVCFV